MGWAWQHVVRNAMDMVWLWCGAMDMMWLWCGAMDMMWLWCGAMDMVWRVGLLEGVVGLRLEGQSGPSRLEGQGNPGKGNPGSRPFPMEGNPGHTMGKGRESQGVRRPDGGWFTGTGTGIGTGTGCVGLARNKI
jgi:hypothetical protein